MCAMKTIRTSIFVTAALFAAANAADVRSLSGMPEWDARLRTFQSTKDGTDQPFYWYDPGSPGPVPLVVAFHSWSADWRTPSPAKTVAAYCEKNGWAMVYPNFRGPNNRPEACGSDLAVQDVVDVVEWAKKSRPIDADRVYVIGGSGGGHMTLLMSGRHPEMFAGAAAFCPITDLSRWHDESLENRPGRGARYARMMESACGGVPADRKGEYAKRSPLSYLAKARAAGLPVYVATGIHDGHRGSVPVGHSIRAFNALADAADRISEQDISAIETDEEVPARHEFSGNDPFYVKKNRVHLRATSANVRLTVFEGGHDGNYPAGLDFLARQRRGCKADMTLPSAANGVGIEGVTK